jgi:hypothetical protein
MTTTDRWALPPIPQEWTPAHPTAEGWLDGYLQHFSASGLRLLRVCPRAWQERYIHGKKERPGAALTVGKAVHSATGFSHTQKIQSHEDLPVTEVLQYYHDVAWPEAIEQDGGVEEIRWDEDSKPEDVRNDGQRMTQAYHLTVSPRIQPLAVEKRIDFVVPGIPVPFVGYVDVEEEGNLDDLKTGKQVTRKPDANWRTQGTLYAAHLGKPCHFHSVSRAKTPSIATPLESPEMVVTPHPHTVETITRVLHDYAMQAAWYFETYGPDDPWPTNGIFMDYKGGRVCDFCGFRKDCPAWAHEREIVLDMVDIHGKPIRGTV